MWHCSYCPHTSSRKFNMHVHEKRKHSTQILADAVKNEQITEVKDEDDHLLDIEKPAKEVPIAYVKPKSYVSLQLKRKEKQKLILKYCRRLIKIIKELEEIKQPRRLKTDQPPPSTPSTLPLPPLPPPPPLPPLPPPPPTILKLLRRMK